MMPPDARETRDVTCPFCGLGCDDLVVATAGDRLAVRANGCPISVAAFERPSPPAGGPRLAGDTTDLARAIAEAARLLRGAALPLFAGLGTDVAGARALGRLAERCGGVLDHMGSEAAVRHRLARQEAGWITTTLSEVRNRADLLVVASGGVATRFPRFFERCIANRETLFGERAACEIVFLGCEPPAGTPIPGPPPSVVPCDPLRLHEALSVLRALLAGRRLQAGEAAGRPLAEWRALADRLRAARYGVVAWSAADFDFPHAELTLLALCELIKDLNASTRFCGLPLGGTDGEVTFDSVQTWQTGFGSRTSFARGVPEHDPWRFSTKRLLEDGAADVLVWVSSFDERRAPPPGPAPTIALTREGMAFEREPAVCIPVGTPGVDHRGHVFRTDRVVALPLRRLRASRLPSVAEVAAAIEREL